MTIGIAARLGWLLALGGLLMAGLTGYYTYDSSRTLLVRSAKSELLTSTQVLARRISLTQQEIMRHLALLALHPAALTALRENGSETVRKAEAEAQLATLFRLMMETNPGYFQIRLIGAHDHGLEHVRVDRSDHGILWITGDALQEKGHFSYVFNTLTLPPGEVYLSRILVNHEYGTHAGLDQPTMQLAMPVTGAQGETLGVIVINVDLNGMFDLLAADLPDAFQLFLTNQDGDYLIHPDLLRTFGFDRGRRVLVQDEFPATRALIEGREDAVVIESVGTGADQPPVVAAFIRHQVEILADDPTLMLGLAQPLADVLAQTQELGVVMLRIVLALSLGIIVFAVLLARFIARPINAMSYAVQHFDSDHLTNALPLERTDEIGILARSFSNMRCQIQRQLAELDERRRELEHMAQHDPLTGLPNRALFADRIESALAAASRDQTQFALMFIDLDHFKPVNDNLGHAIGDQLLKRVAERLHDSIRASDTAARIGGDEFVVLLRLVQQEDDALAVAEKIREAIRVPYLIEGHAINLSASLGIAIYPDHGVDILALSKHADQAMYRAKGQRDAVMFHTD